MLDSYIIYLKVAWIAISLTLDVVINCCIVFLFVSGDLSKKIEQDLRGKLLYQPACI